MNRRPLDGAALTLLPLLPAIRAVAFDHGYTLAFHGSLTRDIDLVAIPWTWEAKPARVLAKAIQKRIGGFESRHFPNIVSKPHGRLCWSWYLTQADADAGSGPYVDLSIMPCRKRKENAK